MSKVDINKHTVPVGTIIHDCGLLYEVVEDFGCSDCCFYIDEGCCIPDGYLTRGFGSCAPSVRMDSKSVIYKIVGEDKEFKL